MDTQTEVLIMGAGPTGLSLACQLLRYGVDFVIVDKNDGLTTQSKAVGVHARTLEIYEQIGLAQAAIEEGTIAGKVCLLAGGEERAVLDLSRVGEGLSRYPFVLILEQSKNEKLLHEYSCSRGKEVWWRSELQSLSQDENGVTAQIQNADGTMQSVRSKYFVACDGAHSPTRHLLNLKFEGSSFERTFYVADTHVKWNRSHDAAHFFLTDRAFLLFFPLRGEHRYRIVGVFPEEFADDGSKVLYEAIEARIKTEAQIPLELADVEWFSTYKVHTRHVENFRSGRCFLAGDAAHIHSPAGAQGMNTGIGDTYNLAWKLALVLRNRACASLLDTYNEERLENAKTLLQTTDRMFNVFAGTDWFLAALRHLLPAVAERALGFESARHLIFPRISQIGIHYRHGSLSRHAGDEGFQVKAGDRMPYLEAIYDHLHAPKFHWLIFSDAPNDASTRSAEIEAQHRDYLDVFAFPLSPQIRETFGTDKPFSVLLRPDNHIAFLNAAVSADAIEDYLARLARSNDTDSP